MEVQDTVLCARRRYRAPQRQNSTRSLRTKLSQQQHKRAIQPLTTSTSQGTRSQSNPCVTTHSPGRRAMLLKSDLGWQISSKSPVPTLHFCITWLNGTEREVFCVTDDGCVAIVRLRLGPVWL
jgi:hypothetical protein